MTDTNLLREKIDLSGYKLRFIAKKTGITYQSLLNKINNRSEFRANEIQSLYNLLGMTENERVAIFFCRQCRLKDYTQGDKNVKQTNSFPCLYERTRIQKS